MGNRITIVTEMCSSGRLYNLLDSQMGDMHGEDITISEVSGATDEWRGIDQAVLIALVGASGTALGALVTGLCGVVQQLKGNSVVLVGRNGERVECPAAYTAEKIKEMIELRSELDVEKIVLKTDAFN